MQAVSLRLVSFHVFICVANQTFPCARAKDFGEADYNACRENTAIVSVNAKEKQK